MFPFQIMRCLIFPGDRMSKKPLSFLVEMLNMIVNGAFVTVPSTPALGVLSLWPLILKADVIC